MSQSPYGVRVTLTSPDGSTHLRNYVRGTVRMSRDKFASWALGDMMMLLSDTRIVSFEVQELTRDELFDLWTEEVEARRTRAEEAISNPDTWR